MVFIDETRINVKAGHGGSGCVSTRRERFVPLGGPDGGDGGDGGSIILTASSSSRTLSDYRYRRHFKSKRGQHGMGSKKYGHMGQNLELVVPEGTVVYSDEGKLIADLREEGDSIVVARGGQGGRGNAALATSKRSVPGFSELGGHGEERWIKLELRLLADAGIVGLPNAGKSSFLAAVTRAAPKIADYPFTTLTPQLGVVELEDHETFVLADIPGVIEGAHEGKGLGHQFLRHVRRSAVLLIMVDLSGEDPVGDLDIIRSELSSYDKALAERDWICAGNKMDLNPDEGKVQAVEARCVAIGTEFFPVSVATREGLDKLLWRLDQVVAQSDPNLLVTKSTDADEEMAPGTLHYVFEETKQFKVVLHETGVLQVLGDKVEQMIHMTDMANEEAVEYLQDRLRAAGVERALGKAGAHDGDEVMIGETVFYFNPIPGRNETTDE